MCAICRQTPCAAACPDAPPMPIRCDRCGAAVAQAALFGPTLCEQCQKEIGKKKASL